TWQDLRAEPQARRWHDWLGAQRVFEITGQPIQARMSVNQLLWQRENQPEVLERAVKRLCVEDFVLWKLSGEYATEFSLSSRTMAIDQRNRRWSREILDLAEIPEDLFPPLYQSGTPLGQVTARAAAETGLPAGTAVVVGGHDHLCGAFAAGVLGPGAILNSMGTAEACLVVTNEFSPDERLVRGGYSHYAHIMPGQYVVVFGLGTSGGMFEWLVRQLHPESTTSPEARIRAFDLALAAAAEVRPGSEGLFWLAHFAGVGPPWVDELSKAAVLGLTPAHGRGHLVRALLESLSYRLRENISAVAEAIEIPANAELVVIGGGTRAKLWMQIKADVSGRLVRVVQVPEAVATGAALLAGIGAGVFKSFAEAAASVERPVVVYEPDTARAQAYDRYYREVFEQIYPTLRSLNHRIHDVFWSGKEG
ncbi:MAG: FGGY-family carbohydrate kinase, partial [Chloroflexota bacterium]